MGYGHSKMLMEKALRAEITAKGPMEIVFVGAPGFTVPTSRRARPCFFQMVRDGKFPIVGNCGNRRSVGYTDNLAQGILLAPVHPKAAREIFRIADEAPHPMN